MTRLRRLFVLLAVACLSAAVAPAFAQSAGTSGEFSYSPEAQQRGGSVTISGKCVIEGTTSNVDMIVTVRQGADGQGDYLFSKVFTPSESGAISGTIEVPGDAPFGEYAISGSCRNGRTTFFSKTGPFTVGDRAPAPPPPPAPATTTTTSAPSSAATSTTSTTVVGETTTTSAVDDVVEQPDTFNDDDEDFDLTPSTTIDEFAGTRTDDNDSIGPLLLLVGVVPLLLAVAAIAFALRRRSANPAASTPDA